MSRAIPSSFSEYLLDSTSQASGIICDGGIMPLRNNPDPTSTWYKKCLRGEDIMFLKEAIAARMSSSTNDGLTDNQFKPLRLTLLKSNIGSVINSGWWTDYDPCNALSLYDFGSSVPSRQPLETHLQSLLNPITQHSASDTYTQLDSAPILNFFKDIKELNYRVQTGVGYNYGGFVRSTALSTHRVRTVGHSDGTATTTTTDQTVSSWLWYDTWYESYFHDGHYPNGLRDDDRYTTANIAETFNESTASASYRQFHRYLAARPFGVFNVRNEYSADWAWSGGASGQDTWSANKYVLAPYPIYTFTDMLTNTSVVVDNQSDWAGWVDDMFDFAGLEKSAADITGQYEVTDNSHQRRRNAIIDLPSWTFWVFHFLYCNLEGVTIQ